MIYIKDDFLEESLIELLNKNTDSFQKVDTPGKSFWVKLPSDDFIGLICDKLGKIENCYIKPILGFFREAKEDQDNDWRIHNDSIIEGQRPDRAIVLYISADNFKDVNGTAFWEHKLYGDKFLEESPEKYDKLISEDSNNLDKWTLKTIIGHKQNRLLSYPCNYFHSKYPNEFIDSRIVFVMFYKIEK
jgi:hypothetical protein